MLCAGLTSLLLSGCAGTYYVETNHTPESRYNTYYGPYYYPYYYDPYYYAPAYTYYPAPNAVYLDSPSGDTQAYPAPQRSPAPRSQSQYYCPDSGYYPSVQSCPKGWLRVVPESPPAQ